MDNSQDFALLERRIKSTVIQNFAIGVFTLLIGLGMLAGSVLAAMQQQWQATAILLLGGVAALFGGWGQIQNGRSNWPPRTSKIYTELTGSAPSLVWAHIVGGSTSGVRIHWTDGERITLLANVQDRNALMHLIQKRAPHAILGYGPQQQKLYQEQIKAHQAHAKARSLSLRLAGLRFARANVALKQQFSSRGRLRLFRALTEAPAWNISPRLECPFVARKGLFVARIALYGLSLCFFLQSAACTSSGSSLGSDDIGAGGDAGAESGGAAGGESEAGAGGADAGQSGASGSSSGDAGQGGSAQGGASQGGAGQSAGAAGEPTAGQGGAGQAGSNPGGAGQGGSGGAAVEGAVDACIDYQDYDLGGDACIACREQKCKAEFAALDSQCTGDLDTCLAECPADIPCFCKCTTSLPGGCGQIESAAYTCMAQGCSSACGAGVGGSGGSAQGGAGQGGAGQGGAGQGGAGQGGAGGAGGSSTNPKQACITYQDYLLDSNACLSCRDKNCKAVFDQLFADCSSDGDVCTSKCGSDLDCFCGCTTTLAGGCGAIESEAYTCVVDHCDSACQ